MVKIKLTKSQMEKLSGLVDQKNDAYNAGQPGVILGQFFPDNHLGTVHVYFIDHDLAKAIERFYVGQ